ncbi:MAG: hypothetical protein AAFR60_05925, partial [Pseudomonadota bacterium]
MTQDLAEDDPELHRVKALLERLELGLDPLADPAELSDRAPADRSSSSKFQDLGRPIGQPSTEIVSQEVHHEPSVRGRLPVRVVTALVGVAVLGSGALYLHQETKSGAGKLFETAWLPGLTSTSDRPAGPATAASEPLQSAPAAAPKSAS